MLPKFLAKFPYVLRKFFDESFLFQTFRSLLEIATPLRTRSEHARKKMSPRERALAKISFTGIGDLGEW